MAQFSLRRESWWQEGHPTVETKMPCQKKCILSAVATFNRKKKRKKKKIKNSYLNCAILVEVYLLRRITKSGGFLGFAEQGSQAIKSN